jgi:hypothetical protein
MNEACAGTGRPGAGSGDCGASDTRGERTGGRLASFVRDETVVSRVCGHTTQTPDQEREALNFYVPDSSLVGSSV